MASTEFITLITKSRDAAQDALKELKRLNREGWIDITCHALLDEDAKGVLRIRDTSDRTEAIGVAVNAVWPSAAGGIMGVIRGELQAGDSALLVIVEQRYAERVAEAFENRGQTLRRQMQGSQCELALRASIEESKSKIAWLEELLEHESDKARWTTDSERERLESAIRAGRTELGAEQEHLQARLLALRSELEAHLLEITRKAETEDASAEGELGRGIVEVERDIADINEDLALSILGRLDGLATRASELREKVALATVDAAEAFEDQLHEIETHMRKYRADLTATLASSASLGRHCVERIRANARQGKAGMESTLQNHRKQLEQRYARLKADIQRLQAEEARTWRDLAVDVRQAWRGLRESLDQSMPEPR